jgi:HEAT repeat protein
MFKWLSRINLEKNMEFVTSHSNYLVRWKAAELLGRKDDSTVLPALRIALNDQRLQVREAAEDAIAEIELREGR